MSSRKYLERDRLPTAAKQASKRWRLEQLGPPPLHPRWQRVAQTCRCALCDLGLLRRGLGRSESSFALPSFDKSHAMSDDDRDIESDVSTISGLFSFTLHNRLSTNDSTFHHRLTSGHITMPSKGSVATTLRTASPTLETVFHL